MRTRKAIRTPAEREMARLQLVRQRAEISAALASGMPVSALCSLLAGVYGGVTVTEEDVRSYCRKLSPESLSEVKVPELVRRALSSGGHRVSHTALDVLRKRVLELCRNTELSITDIREFLIDTEELPPEVSLSALYEWLAKEKNAA